jgi:thiamine pyrophosphokinase
MSTLESRSGGGDFCPIFLKEGPRAVVLCDGPPPPAALLDYWLQGSDLFVCTDAAGHPYDHLPRMPDAVIGDFDSLTGRILSGKNGPRYLLVKEQDTTDSEKALHYVSEQGMTEAVLLGAVGWRLDHTLHNCFLLERFAGRLRLCLAGHQSDSVRVDPNQPVTWRLAPGTGFSLMPLAGPVSGVTVQGARYPLENALIRVGGPATISNRVQTSPLRISVTGGSLLVAVERGGRPDLAGDAPGS